MASPAISFVPSSRPSAQSHPSELATSPTESATPLAADISPSPNTSASASVLPLAAKPAAEGLQKAHATPPPSKPSITSKEWIVPPRPKPGRKPATDTPPTKRKAQNRAAQRAFRERRAARVGELEEELEEQREEHERVQKQLREEIQSLTAQVESLRSRCATIEEMLDKERVAKENLAAELESYRLDSRGNAVSNVHSRKGSLVAHQGRLQTHSHSSQRQITGQITGHRKSTTPFSIPQIISPPDSSASLGQSQGPDVAGCGNCSSAGPCACVDALAGATLGCGKCTLGTTCECLETALGSSTTVPEFDLKRKSSSSALELAPDEKRQKTGPFPDEIDFTTKFSSKRSDSTTTPSSTETLPVQPPSRPPREPCGFCTESSYCLCAEAPSAPSAQPLVPISQQVQTPPSSEDDAVPSPFEVTSTGAIKLPSLSSLRRNSFQPARNSGSCGVNGPGTCSQCLSDPKSGLFCRSLANIVRESGNTSGGCCGGSNGSGCCKTANQSTSNANLSSGVSLSCADAYQTLSSHPGFDLATDEIETWLPKLRAVPKVNAFGQRTALDVETASIMGVLKEFDVRFARNA
ncbi:hypothetical protein GGR50DRAFT_697204 [Xylaria sp. CBS 124048]|nr:hypothetical protein GGR50DRAFT_697204 [Xylaria sp. CBS 124048]